MDLVDIIPGMVENPAENPIHKTSSGATFGAILSILYLRYLEYELTIFQMIYRNCANLQA